MAASAATVEVKTLPGGGSANSKSCQGVYTCETTAEARDKDAPQVNCTTVAAEAIAVGAVVSRPVDYDSTCSTTSP